MEAKPEEQLYLDEYNKLKSVMGSFGLHCAEDIAKLAYEFNKLKDAHTQSREKHKQALKTYYNKNKEYLNRKRNEYARNPRHTNTPTEPPQADP